MVEALPLPPLAGTRKRAQGLLEQLPPDLSGSTVVVDCRGLVAATLSFADELIQGVLVDRKAKEMRFTNVADLKFALWVDQRADFHGVSKQVKVDRKA
ncbi:hypothetical protein [Rhodococcus erythropolis]|uniref:hypothetical protein n=1 Tax=Rhodococcus erythropolis TaxID=1833 RepID=UPI0008B54F6F|nr:hypothetical protein [Rhodococcus erythropolis]OFV77031.1 hypothetical protein RERY_21940 [Rhodococcus erythropolis]